MSEISKRLLSIDLPRDRSAFLWGPRKVGKTYWLGRHCQDAILIDLLKTDVFAEYASRPSLLRERYKDHSGLVVIDEIQMLPELLNEIHWMIENTAVNFLMTGSSARKLRRAHANLLGGRAWRFTMCPLAYPEITGFDIESIMISGLLPSHLLSSDPLSDLRAYTGDYLQQEIASEATVRSLPVFAGFLRACALSSGQLLNYANVAREAGVSAKVVRSYFEILEDTLLGFTLPAWRRSEKRRLIGAGKFYLFDVGLCNYLARRTPQSGTPEFGQAFEHYILMELCAYRAYRNPELDIAYWRTSTGIEVDFILGNMEVAIEVKSSVRVHEKHTSGLRALMGDTPVRRAIVVCQESEPRKTDSGIEVLPWRNFLEQLWADEIVR